VTRDEDLRRIPLLATLAPRRGAALAPALREVRFPAGHAIRRPGQSCDRIAFVTEGEVRVTRTGPTGREIALYRIVPGEACVLELSAAMSGTTYPAWAVASRPGRALTVPASELVRLMGEDEGLRAAIVGLLSSRLIEVMALVGEVAFEPMEDRLASLLRREARGDPPVVASTHEALARSLGTAREVVSRHLSQMAVRGEVRLARGAITLLSLPDGD
jgi:CRP/FNR family transcriptional regulator, anaerobic regulatory protein